MLTARQLTYAACLRRNCVRPRGLLLLLLLVGLTLTTTHCCWLSSPWAGRFGLPACLPTVQTGSLSPPCCSPSVPAATCCQPHHTRSVWHGGIDIMRLSGSNERCAPEHSSEAEALASRLPVLSVRRRRNASSAPAHLRAPPLVNSVRRGGAISQILCAAAFFLALLLPALLSLIVHANMHACNSQGSRLHCAVLCSAC